MTFKPKPWPRKLRSQEWFGGTSKDAIYHRGWMKNQGLPADLFDGRPVIGILNTWSELNPCNAHLKALAESGGMLGFSVYPHHLKGGGGCSVSEFCSMIARTADLIGLKLSDKLSSQNG